MLTKEKAGSTANITLSQIPILNIRMMTDEEWNKLAYRNLLERQVSASGEK